MATPSWLSAVTDPDPMWGPQPLWSWNTHMDRDLILRQLDQLAAAGCTGVYIHPRPGLITEYLSEDWFALWRFTADACRERGLMCHIYDENSYPSGFAGGHVLAAEPNCAARFARLRVYTAPMAPTEPVLCCANGQGQPLAQTAWREASPERPVLVLTQAVDSPDAWHASRPLPDLTLPETTRAFLASTHAAYVRHLGDHLGDTTRLVFTDEPTILHPADGVLYSPRLRRSFLNDHGYDLLEQLPLLACDGPTADAVRFDYFTTCNRLLCEHFFQPVYEYCERNSLLSSGHVNEHRWPDPQGLPSAMAALRWMHAPGNDLLGFQFPLDNPTALSILMARFNLHELESIAQQCGRRLRMVESCGGGGYQWNPQHCKALEDFLLCFGVNHLVPHLSHASLAGTRAYDWPQTMSEHSPWLSDYVDQASHVRHVIAAMAQGQARAPGVLVLNPTTTGWIIFRMGGSGREALQRLREEHLGLIAALDAAQVAFHLGDEQVMEALARVEGSVLQVGEAQYRVCVLPSSVGNLSASTCALLERWLLAGGQVWLEGTRLPSLVQGRHSERTQAWRGVRFFQDRAALLAALRQQFPPEITAADGSPLAERWCSRVHYAPDGTALCLLANPWTQALRASVCVPGNSVQQLDTLTAQLSHYPSTVVDSRQHCEVELPPGGHVLLLCSPQRQKPLSVAPPAWKAVATALAEIQPDRENIVLLDHVSLEVQGHPAIFGHCVRVDTHLWQVQGFAQSPWTRSIQFAQNTLHCDTGDSRPFTLRYTCELAPDCPRASLALAMERPWLWRISVNGQRLEHQGERYFDQDRRRIPCGALLQAGTNQIVLARDGISPLCEVAPLWLLGDLRAVPQAAGFQAQQAKPLQLGDLSAQGFPTYWGSVQYHLRCSLDTPASQLRVELPAWEGVCVRVSLGGQLLGRLWRHRSCWEGPVDLPAGVHVLTLTVVGDLGNTLGPHHGTGLAGRWTWERPWEPEPLVVPAGSQYRVQPLGLFALPRVAVCMKARPGSGTGFVAARRAHSVGD